MKTILRFFYEGSRPGLRKLTRKEYEARLVGIDSKMAERAFDRAWATRNFEIELYWKRATYFWAFIASAFVGYFGLINSTSYLGSDPFQHVEVFFIACLGFLLSLAWLLTSVGSKQWQRHWEIHVDLLEDQFTGPLYKTVHPSLTYSVSKINEIVAASVMGIWVLLAIKYLAEQGLLHMSGHVIFFALVASLGTVVLSIAMLFGRGRGRFGARQVAMYARSVYFSEEDAARSHESDLDVPVPEEPSAHGKAGLTAQQRAPEDAFKATRL